MAQAHVDFFSGSLMRTVSVKVIIPTDKQVFPGEAVYKKRTYPTLYLLHGVLGNDTDWLSGTRVQMWAEDHNLAVVMPSGENKFYVDNEAGPVWHLCGGGTGAVYTGYLSPLLQMGGYGALVNGLKYHEVFGRICAFSSALILERFRNADDSSENLIERRSFYESSMGPLENVTGSDKDYFALARKTAGQKEKPSIYMACGKEDSLLPENRSYRDFLRKEGYDVTYEEWTGNHDWIFWDQCIQRVMSWLPVGEAVRGVGSDNTLPQIEKS